MESEKPNNAIHRMATRVTPPAGSASLRGQESRHGQPSVIADVRQKSMAISEFEHESVKMAVDSFIALRRPPEHLRDRVDLAYSWDGTEVVIYEIRPRWDDASVIIHENVARAKYIKTTKKWKVFWQRADLKWHAYPPKKEVNSISDFLEEVNLDPHGCFWG